ncbi:unnamed protein product [Sphenostylis stenocarpa]|uniref:Uncharacterized protein n=1 Tax=Sphenostylis stenocarpa TaxID=92480 RepID=A0AA86SZ76_9FABA|nr:unnamed protein product [Sphenostylis stenocarpa]
MDGIMFGKKGNMNITNSRLLSQHTNKLALSRVRECKRKDGERSDCFSTASSTHF